MNPIHCLSSSVVYLAHLKDVVLQEPDLAVNIESFNVIDKYLDTNLNNVILSWIKRNTKFEFNSGKSIDFSKTSILNLPIKYLTYAKVYDNPELKDVTHFVVASRLGEKHLNIVDCFVPTMPISKISATINLDDIDFADVHQIVIDKFKTSDSQFNKPNINEFEFVDLNNFINLAESTDVNEIMQLIVMTGESSFQGSRELATQIQNSVVARKMMDDWNYNWRLIRIWLYKYFLTNKHEDMEKAISYIRDLQVVDNKLMTGLIDYYRM